MTGSVAVAQRGEAHAYTVLALGDGVASGHGLGPDPDPFAQPPIVNVHAYPALVAEARHVRLVNLAQSGACVVAHGERAPVKADPRTPTTCRGSVARQVRIAIARGVVANLVLLAVGADDIRLGDCFRVAAGLFDPNVSSPCAGAQLSNTLAAYAANLRRVSAYIQRSYPGAKVMVATAYEPVPSTNGVATCDLSRVGYLAHAPASRFEQRAFRKAAFEAGARRYQQAVYSIMSGATRRLNAITLANVERWSRTGPVRSIDLSIFNGHDPCRQYVPNRHRPWEFGPIINLRARVQGAGNPPRVVSYTVDPAGDCTRFCQTHDPKSTPQHPLAWCNTTTPNDHATCNWQADGSSYPNQTGQTEIAHLILKFL
jgi:hypothetical protein